VSRSRNQNQVFVILLVLLAVALWYGAVFAGTAGQCANGGTWVWTPPPHWRCLSGFGQ